MGWPGGTDDVIWLVDPLGAGPLKLLTNSQDVFLLGRKGEVPHVRAGPGVGIGAVAGHVAVIALAPAGPEGFARIDQPVQELRGDPETR